MPLTTLFTNYHTYFIIYTKDSTCSTIKDSFISSNTSSGCADFN